MKSEKNYGGVWMLVGMVVLLTVPMVIGHYALPPASDVTLHADAEQNSATN